MLLILELVLSAIVLLCLGFGSLRIEYKPVLRLEQYVSRYARRKKLAVLLILLLALGARLAVLPVEPVPVPGIHDEFSYLLMADTFAHGRLTNPTHPMWRHFETFHVNQQPTYCSKYFPAQGIFLALGQVVFGHPFWGVWLSTGLMCASICWALQSWIPPGWAFLGGILVVLRLGIFTYWANSYWGGSVTALGGALVLGAWPRIKRRVRLQDAVILAIGLGILANSRPYEGLFYSLPILFALGLWCFRQRRRQLSLVLARVALPMLVVFAVVLASMGYYFRKTTGECLRSPYSVYSARYDPVPLFPWQKLKSVPPYNHAVMRTAYTSEFLPQYFLPMFQYRLFRQAPWLALIGRAIPMWWFFIGPALSIPICICIGLYRWSCRRQFSPKMRFLVFLNVAALVPSLVVIYFNPHYLAPMLPAWYALLLFSMRRVWVWDRQGDGRGRSAIRATIMICVLMAFVQAGTARMAWAQQPFFPGNPNPQQLARAPLLSRLQREEGKHLVMVRYAANHIPHYEWVYNGADIDGSKVVWAREMGAEEDAKLIAYFKDRHVWLVQPDQQPLKLSRYPRENGEPVTDPPTHGEQ